jgi:putative FmdB family regulatory protein
MPTYQFRCRSCGDTFDVTRPMAQSADHADCPQGHSDTVRLLSFAGGLGMAPAAPGADSGASAGGGCCGGGCCG